MEYLTYKINTDFVGHNLGMTFNKGRIYMSSNTDTFIIGLMVFHETSLKQFQGVVNMRDIKVWSQGSKAI